MNAVPRHQVSNNVGSLPAVANQLAVDMGDDIAGKKPGEVGGAVDMDVGDNQSPRRVEAEASGHIRRQLLRLHTEPAANDTAVLDDVFHNTHCGVGGDGKSQTHRTALVENR